MYDSILFRSSSNVKPKIFFTDFYSYVGKTLHVGKILIGLKEERTYTAEKIKHPNMYSFCICGISELNTTLK